jgi:hypothetical protein
MAIVRSKIPKEDELTRWTQEAAPAIRELQEQANREYSGRFTHTTTLTAAFETAWTSDDLPVDGGWRIYLEIQARATDGSTAYYEIQSVWKRSSSGVATQVGSTAAVTPSCEDVSSWDVQFLASTNGVVAQVKGDAARTVDWVIYPYVVELT